MKKLRTHAPKSLLIAGLASVALVGGACASDDGASPGQEAPAEDPMAPTGETTTGGETTTTGGSTGMGTSGGETTAGTSPATTTG